MHLYGYRCRFEHAQTLMRFHSRPYTRHLYLQIHLSVSRPLKLFLNVTHYPPFHTQDKNAAVVDKVLSSIGESDIAAVIKDLDTDACDVLMKYVYRSMATNPLPVLLKIHASLLVKAGLGSVIRVMADRKSV